MNDVVVVGAGAAGLSAALVLGRARRRVVVVDAGTPRNAPAAHLQGFLSRDGMAPKDLLAAGRAEIGRYGVWLVDGEVTEIAGEAPDVDSAIPEATTGIEAAFSVRLPDGSVLPARRILLATGLRDELPEIPGVRQRWGRDVLHCPYCHGWEVRDQQLGVLGTHPAAVEHALLVRQWSADVVFFTHTHDLTAADRTRLDAVGVRVVDGRLDRLVVAADRLAGVQLADGDLVRCAAVFIRPHLAPRPDGLLAGLGCAVDEAGFAVVDATGRTSVAGVWAAGNVADPRAQVITAAGAGSAAAIAINADLVLADADRAVANRL